MTECILIRLTDTTGTVGWGEIPVQAQNAAASWNALTKQYAPRLLAHAWNRPTEVLQAWAEVSPAPGVQAGLDMACWALWSQQRLAPLAHSLGGSRTAVPAGARLELQADPELVVRAANRAAGRGILRLRLDVAPGHDVEPVRALREVYPYLALQVDCGGRYTESPEHLAALRALDSYGLVAIEQPFGATDLAAHTRLQRDLHTPLALGAELDSLETLDRAIAVQAAGALRLRPARLGGLTVARRAHDRAVDAGWQVWCDNDAMVGPGLAAVTALATLPGVTLPSDLPGAAQSPGHSVLHPPVRVHDGIIPVPLTEPGLGYAVDEAVVAARTAHSVTLRG